jgi:hypothetical protein
MQGLAFWKAVTEDRAGFLESLIALLTEHKIPYCVIGGVAVNAYAEPTVSLDLELVIASDAIEQAASLFAERFEVERSAPGLNVSMPGSKLRVQVETDPRSAGFVERSSTRKVLGLTLPVASPEDILEAKLWAAADPERLPSKRMEDLFDISRLLEFRPQLRARVPAEIRERLL